MEGDEADDEDDSDDADAEESDDDVSREDSSTHTKDGALRALSNNAVSSEKKQEKKRKNLVERGKGRNKIKNITTGTVK